MASEDLRRQAPSEATDGGADLAADRRRFLRRAMTGGAVAIGVASAPVFAPAALAQPTPGTTPGSTPGSTPTTSAAAAGAGGSKGTAAKVAGRDLELAQFLISIELALVELYEAADEGGRLRSVGAVDQARRHRGQHHEQADRVTEFAGSQAPVAPNRRLVDEWLPRVTSANDEKALATVLHDAENSAAATCFWALGQIEGWELAAEVAAIGGVHAQQSVALSRFVDDGEDAWVARFDTFVPVRQTDEGHWEPSSYPVTGS